MIVTVKHLEGYHEAMRQMNDVVVDALNLQSLGLTAETAWHVTRRAEYPWALQMAGSLRGKKVLDIGAHPPFGVFLLHSGACQDLTLLHTSQDTKHIPMAYLMEDGGRHSLHDLWKRYEKNLKLLWGFPDQVDVAAGTYDVIFNISVMEHVPRKYVWSWALGQWRLLKPGGRLVMTCDWGLDIGKGEGADNHLVNHDWWPWVESSGARLTHLVPEETPWHPGFDTKKLPKDLFTIPYPEAGVKHMAVYGVVLEKPE